ncbi:UNVERIFIED_CONTAM: hypothetical protein HDU68_006929, partial [Siphonaria sp. JEL0065]
GDIAGTAFLELLEKLAVSGMQDFVAADLLGFFDLDNGKTHIIKQDTFWSDPEFLEFRAELVKAMESAVTPQQEVLDSALPIIGQELRTLTSQVSFTSSRVETVGHQVTDGFAKSHKNQAIMMNQMNHLLDGLRVVGIVLATIGGVAAQQSASFDMRAVLSEYFRNGDGIADTQGMGEEETRISNVGGAHSQTENVGPVPARNSATTEKEETARAEKWLVRGKFLTRSNTYDLKALWAEFKTGLPPKPSVDWMEATFKTAWRNNTETQFYGVRKAIVDEIEKKRKEGVEVGGKAEETALEDAIAAVDVLRNGRSIDALGKDLRKAKKK